MRLPEGPLCLEIRGRAEPANDHPSHHLHQRRDIVFGLIDIGGAGHAAGEHILAKLRQRFFVEKPGEVVR